jgi:hypothetical protein
MNDKPKPPQSPRPQSASPQSATSDTARQALQQSMDRRW